MYTNIWKTIKCKEIIILEYLQLKYKHINKGTVYSIFYNSKLERNIKKICHNNII